MIWRGTHASWRTPLREAQSSNIIVLLKSLLEVSNAFLKSKLKTNFGTVKTIAPPLFQLSGRTSKNKWGLPQDLYNFLQQFYQLFPEQQPNDFYAFGESYGGKYAPQLALKIHQENQQLDGNKIKINLGKLIKYFKDLKI